MGMGMGHGHGSGTGKESNTHLSTFLSNKVRTPNSHGSCLEKNVLLCCGVNACKLSVNMSGTAMGDVSWCPAAGRSPIVGAVTGEPQLTADVGTWAGRKNVAHSLKDLCTPDPPTPYKP